MNLKNLIVRNSGKVARRGGVAVETVLLVAALCAGYHFAVSALNDWRGAEWTEERLEALARKAVATSHGAQLAGIKIVKEGSLPEALERLAAGETAQSGPFAGQTYIVDGLSEEKARAKLAAYLKVDRGRLALVPDQERLTH